MGAQKKLGSPWMGPLRVVRQATGHTVGVQKDPEAPIVFIHVDDLKIGPPPALTLLTLHHLWTYPPGIIRTHHHLVLTFTLNWTNPLI